MKLTDRPRLGKLGWVSRLRSTIFGLQCKATVLVAGLVLLVAVLLCGLSVNAAWRLAYRLECEQALQQAVMVSNLSAEPLKRGDVATLRRIVEEYGTGDPSCFLIITDRGGEVLASAEGSGGVPDQDEESALHGGPVLGVPVPRVLPGAPDKYLLDVTYPINWRRAGRGYKGGGSSRLLGYVRLGKSRDRTIAAV